MTRFRSSLEAEVQQPPFARSGSLRSDLIALLFIATSWIATSVVINPLGAFPLNDSWVYALAVRSILDTGRFALPSPASANVFTQAYWGALFCLPLGFSFTALRISTLFIGGIGIVALYLLLRELGARSSVALIGAMTLAVNPIYLGLSASFMTDVPFTALVTLSLWLYVRGIRREQAILLGLAFVTAFLAISIRQFALVLPLAFGATHLARKGLGPRALVTATLPFIFAIALQFAYSHWLVATGRTPHIPVSLSHLVRGSGFIFVPLSRNHLLTEPLYVGLNAVPFLACLFLARRTGTDVDMWQRLISWRSSLRWSAVILGVLAIARGMLPISLLGNILVPSGVGPLTLRDIATLHLNEPHVPDVMKAVWVAVTAISVWATLIVAHATMRMFLAIVRALPHPAQWRSLWPKVLVVTTVGAYIGGTFLLAELAPIFDRYTLPLIPAILAILYMEFGYPPFAARQPWRIAPSVLVLAVYAAFSVPATHDYLAWNRARWRASHFLLDSGIPPRRIDGGYEFDGWYAHSPKYKWSLGKSWWGARGTGNEYIIAAGPLSGYREIRRYRVNRWLGLTEPTVFILRRKADIGDRAEPGR